MPTQAEFIANPLFFRFVEPKFPAAIVEMFLSIAESELEEHRVCMGTQFDLIVFLLTAHRLSKWSSSGLLTDPAMTDVSLMQIAEMRQVVSSLSVSDEAGSESVTFRDRPSNAAIDASPEDFESTEFGILYLSLFEKFRCPRTSWMVL